MEVVSTSKLVSSENEKTTTACNFQTMTMNSFVIPHDLMRGQIGGYVCIAICKHEAIRSFMMAKLKKRPKKHIHKTAISKPTSDKLKEKNCFTLKMHCFCNTFV